MPESSLRVFSLNVNGELRKVKAAADTPLLWILRDELQLTGTKYGCGVGVCGACTVHENGSAVRSCQITVSSAAGRAFTTIEGLAAKTDQLHLHLHSCQQAWIDEDVAQCGFCQPGMIMEAAALLSKHSRPTDADIDSTMSHHVCRCGTYQRIRQAIHRAAEMQSAKPSTGTKTGAKTGGKS